MYKGLIKAKILVLLVIAITLVSCLICSHDVTKELSDTTQYNVDNGDYYSNTKVINHVAKRKNHSYVRHILNDYSDIEGQSTFDEKLFKKNLSSYFNSSIIMAAFILILISSLFIVLRSSRRGYFEETHFMHILILMNYIHQMDGEYNINYLFHTFIFMDLQVSNLTIIKREVRNNGRFSKRINVAT